VEVLSRYRGSRRKITKGVGGEECKSIKKPNGRAEPRPGGGGEGDFKYSRATYLYAGKVNSI